jgi:hypothetical protein
MKQTTRTKEARIIPTIFFPVIFLIGIVQDMFRLVNELVLRLWRLGKLRIWIPKPPGNRRNAWKLWRTILSFVDSFMLLTHILIEIVTGVIYPLSFERMSMIELEDEQMPLSDVDSIHHGAVVIAVVGLSMLVSKRRNTLQSKMCYGALSYYQAYAQWTVTTCLTSQWVVALWNQLTADVWFGFESLQSWIRALAASEDVWEFWHATPIFSVEAKNEFNDLCKSLLLVMRLTLSCWFVVCVAAQVKVQSIQ